MQLDLTVTILTNSTSATMFSEVPLPINYTIAD